MPWDIVNQEKSSKFSFPYEDDLGKISAVITIGSAFHIKKEVQEKIEQLCEIIMQEYKIIKNPAD